MKLLIAIFIFAYGFLFSQALAQTTNSRIIQTAVPFIEVASDSRSSAMGDVGVATSPDANSMNWNVGKMALSDDQYAFSFSYNPWLRKVVDDMYIAYFSGYYKMDDVQAVGLDFKYFRIGSILLTDASGNVTTEYFPYEFSTKLGYSRKLTKNWSMGLSFNFIFSNVSSTDIRSGGVTYYKPAYSLGSDLGLYHTKDIELFKKPTTYNVGIAINNLASKINYGLLDESGFVPTTIRLGSTVTTEIAENHTLGFNLEFSKLLVPTPPMYEVDEDGKYVKDSDGNLIIEKGKDPNRPWMNAVFGSFFDAPGGFKEEMQEIMIGTGVEYWYNETIALRGGYFHENTKKGDRQYFAFGLGILYKFINVDISYLIPKLGSNTSLANTLRVSIGFRFYQEKDIY